MGVWLVLNSCVVFMIIGVELVNIECVLIICIRNGLGIVVWLCMLW